MVMGGDFSHFISVIVAIVLLSLVEKSYGLSRGDFPSEFVFGSGTSAYQVEGAAAEDGRSPSIWDTAAHRRGLGNGDIACDQYHKYKDDVRLMVDTGLDAYRFSISWSRLIPTGRGSVNPKGVQYYNNLINELMKNGIKPHVTLFHYDVPQELEDEYGGWLSKNIVRDFTSYADLCFREFGDRVSHWTTLNEANVFSLGGYDNGTVPPYHCSESLFGDNCEQGDSSIEPYMVGHNCLLAHASVARLYKRKYQAIQNGLIGINVFTYWLIPLTDATEDVLATKRVNDFFVGWLIDPLVFGDYPEIMKKNVGSRLPSFTARQARQIKNSFDFIGLNHYDTMYVKDDSDRLNSELRDAQGDMAAKIMSESIRSPSTHLSSAMQGILEYFKNHYNNPPIYIHENGKRMATTSLNDTSRVEYFTGYIGSLLDALRNGSNTKGYFTWSFMDLYELLGGYGSSYGLYYVDFSDPDLKRYARQSAKWYSNFLKGGKVSIDENTEARKNVYAQSHISYTSH